MCASEDAMRVQFARDGFALLGVVALINKIPCALVFAHHANMTVEHRLAEEIVCSNLDVSVVAWNIKRPVCGWGNDKCGQVVSTQTKRGRSTLMVVGVVRKRGLKLILAKTHTRWDRPIDCGNAVP